MTSVEHKSAQLVARLERLPFSRWHRNFFILAFCGVAFDAADFALFGAALPPVAREFGLGPAQSGLLARPADEERHGSQERRTGTVDGTTRWCGGEVHVHLTLLMRRFLAV